MGGYIPPIFDIHPPNNFDFCPLLSVKEFEPKNGVKKAGPGTTKDRKTKITSRNLKIIPPISKRSPKYADHPPNAGHGLAAL